MTDLDQDHLTALLQLEDELQYDRFDYETAWALGSSVMELARSRSLGVVVAIHRNGQRLFHAALAGTSSDNDEWVERKARVAQRFGHSSLYMGALMDSAENRFAESSFEESYRLDPAVYAAHGGSFPLIVRGSGVIGTLTVSGLPQLEDHALAVEGLRNHLAASR